jgi:hypothetical protein
MVRYGIKEQIRGSVKSHWPNSKITVDRHNHASETNRYTSIQHEPSPDFAQKSKTKSRY